MIYDLIFDNDLSMIVQEMMKENINQKIVLFSKVAKLIRQELLEKSNEFTGHFNANSEKNSVSDSLMTLFYFHWWL